ncbi:MAG: DUF3630 family protein [Thalassotalea sp.]
MQQLVNTYLHEETLEIRFSQPWYQEDIESLASIIYQKLAGCKHIETLQGADRESYRLQWQSKNLALHFDFYSQSCWFEPETAFNISILSEIDKIFT